MRHQDKVARRIAAHRALDRLITAKDAVTKERKIFNASTQTDMERARKAAAQFLADKQSEGFVGFTAMHGPYGWAVTYWKVEAKDLHLSNPCPYCDKPHDPSNQCRLAPVAKSPLKAQLKKSVCEHTSTYGDGTCRFCGAKVYDAKAKDVNPFKAERTAELKPYEDKVQGRKGMWSLKKMNGGKFESSTIHPSREHAEVSAKKSGHRIVDAIQHVAVEPVRGGYQTRVMHGENTAQRQGFGTKRQAEKYGERTLAKLAKQAEAPAKFKTWRINAQPSSKGECPVCHQQLEVVSGRLVPHTRAYVYGVQKNFKVDPSNKRYRCKGSGAEPVAGQATDVTPCLVCGKSAQPGEHFCSAKCEEQWIAKKYPRDWERIQQERKGKDELLPV